MPTSLLFPPEQRALFAQINRTDAPLSDDLLHTDFVMQAQATPQADAVRCGDAVLSYAELHGLACHLGAQLREAGASRNGLVAVVMEKGWEQVAAVLGVVMSGAAYLPLDARWPAERLQQLLDESQTTVVLTQSRVLRHWRVPAGLRTICVDEERDRVQAAGVGVVAGEQAQPDDLAYVIYTSGSTGRPKGVMITHRAALNTVRDVNERFGVTAADRVLGLSSMSFDLSVYDVFGTLAVGGCLVLPTAEGERDPSQWWSLIGAHGVTIWNSVPALLELLVDYGRRVGVRAQGPGIASVRLAMLSGDWIGLTLPAAIRALAPDCAVMSLGGATEAAIWSVLYPIETVDPDWTSIPYGRPMKNQRLYVLNEAWQLCPVWARGSLYIAGEGLALGYWRDPERTAASFVSHPHTGERLYRTGDLARYRPDGCLELLGREDLQIKLHGHRIEPGEIEAVMLQHPAVAQAAVVAQRTARGDQQLTAFVVPIDPQGQDPGKALFSHAMEKLPQYLHPARIVALERLPLDEFGRIDRAWLEQRDVIADEPAMVQDGDDTLAAVASIIAEVLVITDCDFDQRLLDLGADSVSMIRIANAMEERFGHRPGLEFLFRNPSLRDVADELSAMSSAERDAVDTIR
jgi:amino acid adenylation domain-containing protein